MEHVRLANLEPNERLLNDAHTPHPETQTEFVSIQGTAKCLEAICGLPAK